MSTNKGHIELANVGLLPTVSADLAPLSITTDHDDSMRYGGFTKSPRSGSLRPATATAKSRKRGKQHVYNACLYIMFVIIYSIILRFDGDAVDFTLTVKKNLLVRNLPKNDTQVDKSWHECGTVAEFWQYMNGVFFPVFYSQLSFNNDPQYNGGQGKDGGGLMDRRGYMGGYNNIVGGVRMGQIRINTVPCVYPEGFKGSPASSWVCVADSYDEKTEDRTTPYGYKTLYYPCAESKVNPCNAKDVGYGQGAAYKSPVTLRNYYEPPFQVILANPANPTLDAGTKVSATLQDLEAGKWIDLKTRMVFIDFTIFNANTNRLVVGRLAAEFLLTGGMITTDEFVTLSANSLRTDIDRTFLGVMIILYLFVLYYTYLVLQTLVKCPYKIVTLSVLIDLLHMSLFWVSLYYRIQSYITAERDIANLNYYDRSDTFFNIRDRMEAQWKLDNIDAVNIYISWLKVVSFLYFFPAFRVVYDTLKSSFSKIGAFLVVFALIMFACAVSFQIAFGKYLSGYRNMTWSLLTLVQMALGQFNFEELNYVNPILGPLLFAVFMIMVVHILLNMFVAVIIDSFDEIRRLVESTEDSENIRAAKDIQATFGYIFLHQGLFRIPLVGTHIRKCYKFTKKRVNKHLLTVLSANQVLASMDADGDGTLTLAEVVGYLDKNNDGQITKSEMVAGLKAAGLDGDKAEKLAGAYDANNDQIMSHIELAAFNEDVKTVASHGELSPRSVLPPTSPSHGAFSDSHLLSTRPLSSTRGDYASASHPSGLGPVGFSTLPITPRSAPLSGRKNSMRRKDSLKKEESIRSFPPQSPRKMSLMKSVSVPLSISGSSLDDGSDENGLLAVIQSLQSEIDAIQYKSRENELAVGEILAQSNGIIEALRPRIASGEE